MFYILINLDVDAKRDDYIETSIKDSHKNQMWWMYEDYEAYVYFSLSSPTTYSPGKCYPSAYIMYWNQVFGLHKLFKILFLTLRGELKSCYSVVGQSLVLAYKKKKVIRINVWNWQILEMSAREVDMMRDLKNMQKNWERKFIIFIVASNFIRSVNFYRVIFHLFLLLVILTIYLSTLSLM